MKFKLAPLRELDEFKSFTDGFQNIVPPEVGDKIGEFSEESIGFPTLLSEVFSSFGDNRGSLVSFFLFTLGAVMLCSLSSLCTEKMKRAAEYATTAVGAVFIFTKIRPAVTLVTSSVGDVLNFSASFIPIITGVIAYGGGTSSAAVGAAGANMTLGIMGAFVLPLLNGCVSLVFALGLVGAVGADGTVGLAKRVKSFFTWVMGIASTMLLSSLALQSAIASSSDNAVIRAAKYAAQGAIPIVGGSVSSAMGTLVCGAGYIKTVIGGAALTVILVTVLSPLVLLLSYRFILSFGEGALEFLGADFARRLFSSFKAALDALLAVTALTVTVLIIETAILMRSGVKV